VRVPGLYTRFAGDAPRPAIVPPVTTTQTTGNVGSTPWADEAWPNANVPATTPSPIVLRSLELCIRNVLCGEFQRLPNVAVYLRHARVNDSIACEGRAPARLDAVRCSGVLDSGPPTTIRYPGGSDA
jgi:hypothetical protein